MIPNVAASVSDKFKQRIQVVQKLKEAVEKSWTTTPGTTPTECCQVKYSSGLEYDSRFRSKVDLSNICVKIPMGAPSNPIHVADTVKEAMKTNSRDNPVIKWQYFASEQGMYWNYPAFEDKADCKAYDPRFRPFYVETATPEPKDVVIVIDHSGSMNPSRMTAAKEAAKTVLNTMNPRDRVGYLCSPNVDQDLESARRKFVQQNMIKQKRLPTHRKTAHPNACTQPGALSVLFRGEGCQQLKSLFSRT